MLQSQIAAHADAMRGDAINPDSQTDVLLLFDEAKEDRNMEVGLEMENEDDIESEGSDLDEDGDDVDFRVETSGNS